MLLEEPGQGFGDFTELDVWKKARALKLEVYEVLKHVSASDFDLRDQMRSAARSVPANISEGRGRNTTRDELRFCVIARGSLKETWNHLIDAFDCHYIDRDYLIRLKPSFDDVAKLLNGYIANLQRKLNPPKS